MIGHVQSCVNGFMTICLVALLVDVPFLLEEGHRTDKIHLVKKGVHKNQLMTCPVFVLSNGHVSRTGYGLGHMFTNKTLVKGDTCKFGALFVV